MKVSTIIYIKEILEKEKENHEKAYKHVCEILKQKENKANSWDDPDDKVDGNILAFRNIKKTQYRKMADASDALEDFLNKDWN